MDKLRKMMAKAEADYDEGEAKQEYQQMGDEGFKSGGYSLMKKPKYGSYAQGGKVRDRKLGYGGSRFTAAEIKEMSKTFGEGFMKLVKKDGKGYYTVKNFGHGGAVDDHMYRNQSKETLGQKAIRIGKAALENTLGKGIDKMADAFNTPSHSMADPVGYEMSMKRKAQQEEMEREARAEAELNARARANPSSLLDTKQ